MKQTYVNLAGRLFPTVERRKLSGGYRIDYRVRDVVGCRRGDDLVKLRARVCADVYELVRLAAEGTTRRQSRLRP